MAQNYASLFSNKVAERFYRESQVATALSKDYEFKGAKSVVVYSIPTATMNNYNRTGTSDRYGTATNLDTTIQTLSITRDRSFNIIIDKGDKIQSQMVLDAGAALNRQLREVVVPEYDTYVFDKAARGAGATDATAATKSNAYELFLKAQETMSDANVPDTDRIAFCSYGFYNLLKLSDNFVKDSEIASKWQIQGAVGDVDGVTIVRVPKSRLPKSGGTSTTYASFILIHPSALLAPQQLWEYRIHDDPPGISGWKIEGRFIYDAFVLDAKKDAIYYQGPDLT